MKIVDLMNEKDSMSYQEWISFFGPMRCNEIEELLQAKKQRLEHSINLVSNDTLKIESGKIWIESDRDKWYLDIEHDTLEVKSIFYDFFQAMKDKDTLPKEIQNLENCLNFLKNTMN
jgi:hypothetical protein